MKKKWIAGAVLIALLLILAYWRYRQQDTYHLIRSILKNNPYCEAFQVNEDGSETEYKEYYFLGAQKEIVGLQFEYQKEKVNYSILLSNSSKEVYGNRGEEVSLILVVNEEMSGWYSVSYQFKTEEESKISTINEDGELSFGMLDGSDLFPEEIEDIFRLIEDDIQKRAQKCGY